MANEGVQDQAMGSDTTQANEPVDLAAAFRLVNQANKESASSAVDEEKPGESQSEATIGAGEPESGGDQSSQASGGEGSNPTQGGSDAPEGNEPPVSSGDSGGGSGASSDGDAASQQRTTAFDSVDFKGIKQSIYQDIQTEAVQDVLGKFKKANVKTQWTIGDLWKQDENTGEVVFENPDNPRAPFKSRYEAQQWVDSMNNQIQQQFKIEVTKKQQELLNARQSAFALLDFAPTFAKMTEAEREVLDDLLEDHEIVNADGTIIGYDCNLNSMASKAKKIAARLPKEQKQQQQQPKPTSPATDIKTGSSSQSDGEFKEPKTVGEAMKMLSQVKKGKKND